MLDTSWAVTNKQVVLDERSLSIDPLWISMINVADQYLSALFDILICDEELLLAGKLDEGIWPTRMIYQIGWKV